MPECAYGCVFHKGKVEWHHPIKDRWEIGIWLCEAHHSLLKDRKKKYAGETILDKSLAEILTELRQLEKNLVESKGLAVSLINKH